MCWGEHSYDVMAGGGTSPSREGVGVYKAWTVGKDGVTSDGEHESKRRIVQ